ncbi:MAG: hypothetical protein AB1513_10635 [Pseudomonadota bacterium]
MNLFFLAQGRRVFAGVRWRLVVAGVLLFITLQGVGAYRSELSHDNELGQVNTSLVYGTWTASLLTVLSVVGDDQRGHLEIKEGQTYIDYILSFPPGILTQALGWERPVEGDHGPAWEMRYGLGGTNVVVVPFVNFHMAGVFLILMLYGFFAAWLERAVWGRSDVWLKLLYGTFFVFAPFWFWYGELSLVRGLMSWFVACALFFALPKVARGNS